jgi:hypothetical protein
MGRTRLADKVSEKIAKFFRIILILNLQLLIEMRKISAKIRAEKAEGQVAHNLVPHINELNGSATCILLFGHPVDEVKYSGLLYCNSRKIQLAKNYATILFKFRKNFTLPPSPRAKFLSMIAHSASADLCAYTCEHEYRKFLGVSFRPSFGHLKIKIFFFSSI